MAKKKQNVLQAALDDLPAAEQDREPEAQAPAMLAKAAAKDKAAAKPKPRTVLIGGHFHPDVAKQLNMIAAEEGMKKQDLLTEALNLLFSKKGKKAIL